MSWTTTLNRIRADGPCADSWQKLLRSLGKTKPDAPEVSVEFILNLLGLDDALWALRAVSGHDREIRMLAVSYAKDVQHLMTDPRSHAALDVAEKYAYGNATDDDLRFAWTAAWTAAWEAAQDDAVAAARAAAWTVAWTAVRAAAWDAARDSVAATRDDVVDALRQTQSDRLRAMVRGEWR